MESNQESVMKMFNLPDYTKNKTFAEASKAINDRFKGQDDKDSQDTLAELQERLQQAQEFVKKQSEADAPSPSPADPTALEVSAPADAVAPTSSPVVSPVDGAVTNEHFLGGLLGGKKEGAEGAGGYAGLVTGAMDLGKTAFGKPNVDVSGATEPAKAQSKGAGALGGAAKGAKAGMMFGPWGAAIGGAIGGVAGLVGAGKAQEAEHKARVNFESAEYKKRTNDYAEGGSIYSRRELADIFGNDSNASPGAAVAKVATSTAGKFAGPSSAESILANNKASNVVTTTSPEIAVDETPQAPAKFNAGELLRYAPVAANAGQLLGLKKPEKESYDRLGNVYEKNYVDEKSLQNVVGEDVASMRDKIVSASGGSGSAARANLLGSQLKGTQALSDAYIKAEGVNRAEDAKAQDFKLGVDKTNLQQSNTEVQANAANEGAYQAQKSKLIAALGDDLGGIGKEEMLKKYPELMGMDYNQRGEYLAKIKADKEKKGAAKTLAKAARKKKG